MSGTTQTDTRRGRLPAAGARLEENERADLWQRYKADGDERARERLVHVYAPLVEHIAGGIASRLPGHVDEGDLVSSGLYGLLSAIERFDPGRGIKFQTFAGTRIRGAIADDLRSLDWVPRSVRSRAREIREALAELERRLLRAPTDAEIAAALELSVDELHRSRVDISSSAVLGFDEFWAASSADDQISLLDKTADANALDPVGELATDELRDQLADAIAGLPERQRLVVALYYYENLTLAEIGEVLGVSEPRASQLRTKAVLRLRSALEGELPLALGAAERAGAGARRAAARKYHRR